MLYSHCKQINITLPNGDVLEFALKLLQPVYGALNERIMGYRLFKETMWVWNAFYSLTILPILNVTMFRDGFAMYATTYLSVTSSDAQN